MKVWILILGCKYEGYSIHSVHKTKADGVRAATDYMEKEKADTAERSNPEDPHRVYFSQDNLLYWTEHYCFYSRNSEGVLVEGDYGSHFVELREYDVNG